MDYTSNQKSKVFRQIWLTAPAAYIMQLYHGPYRVHSGGDVIIIWFDNCHCHYKTKPTIKWYRILNSAHITLWMLYMYVSMVLYIAGVIIRGAHLVYLRLLSCGYYVCVCVYVSASQAMKNYSCDLNNWLNKLYYFPLSLYNTYYG